MSPRLTTSKETEAFFRELQTLSSNDLLARINSLLEQAKPYYVNRYDGTKRARIKFVSQIVSPVSYCVLAFCQGELYSNIPQLEHKDCSIADPSLPIVKTLCSNLLVALPPNNADTFICEKIHRSLSGLAPMLKENPDLYFICIQISAIMRHKIFSVGRKIIVPEIYRSFDEQLDQLLSIDA